MTGSSRVVRVEWLPGSDTLVGTCHCGAGHAAQDPVSMWEWLLAHPDGHDAVPAAASVAPALPDRLLSPA